MLRKIWPISKLYALSERVYNLQEAFRKEIVDIQERMTEYQTSYAEDREAYARDKESYLATQEENRQDLWFTKYGYDWMISDLQMTCVEALFPGNRERLLALKDTHVGESCFIIGNGPSLKAEDLDKLKEKHVFCFASKRIYQIFSETEWRPDVWGASDLDYIKECQDEISALKGFPKLICAPAFVKDGVQIQDAIYYPFIQMERRPPWFNLDIMRGVHFWGTITCKLINFAAYMGFKKIYLLGVDNSYAVKKNENGQYVYDVNKKNHFSNDYLTENGKKVLTKNIEDIVKSLEYINVSYQSVKWHCDQMGIEIINTTRGGELEIFPREAFESVMSNLERGETAYER